MNSYRLYGEMGCDNKLGVQIYEVNEKQLSASRSPSCVFFNELDGPRLLVSTCAPENTK